MSRPTKLIVKMEIETEDNGTPHVEQMLEQIKGGNFLVISSYFEHYCPACGKEVYGL